MTTTYSPFEVFTITIFVALVLSPLPLLGYLLVFRTEIVLKRIMKSRDQIDHFNIGYPKLFSEKRILQRYRLIGYFFLAAYAGILGLLIVALIKAFRLS